MAKKKTATKSGPNKTQVVMAQLSKTPNASTVEIAEAASKEFGETISPALVYNVKSNSGLTKKRKPGRKKKATKRVAVSAPASNGMNTALVMEAAKLLQQAGDPKAAQAALDAATKISQVLNK